jgi:hypothetical protein
MIMLMIKHINKDKMVVKVTPASAMIKYYEHETNHFITLFE